MSTPTRNDAYAIEVNQVELDRLLLLGELYNPFVPDGFRRTSVGPGGKVIDVGCGAIGALPALCAIVGPQGVVVGLDMDERSLGLARQILERQNRAQVQLVCGNINDLDPAALCPPGPFDAAFCRLFLMHQPDPVATVRRMAALVHPGGYLIAHEYLYNGAHQSVPAVPAINATQDMWARTMRARGASPDVGTQFTAVCAAAGLREVDQHGWFSNRAASPAVSLAGVRATTISYRAAIMETGTATAAEIDALNQELEEAEKQQYDLLVIGDFMELVAQVPEGNARPLMANGVGGRRDKWETRVGGATSGPSRRSPGPETNQSRREAVAAPAAALSGVIGAAVGSRAILPFGALERLPGTGKLKRFLPLP